MSSTTIEQAPQVKDLIEHLKTLDLELRVVNADGSPMDLSSIKRVDYRIVLNEELYKKVDELEDQIEELEYERNELQRKLRAVKQAIAATGD